MSIRVSMDQCRRMTDVALHLRAAIELRESASDRKMSEVAKEMLEMANYHQAAAFALMDFSIDADKSAASLITPTPNVDIIQKDCADGRHRYGRESRLPEFKGRRTCRCGAVEGELPS